MLLNQPQMRKSPKRSPEDKTSTKVRFRPTIKGCTSSKLDTALNNIVRLKPGTLVLMTLVSENGSPLSQSLKLGNKINQALTISL